MGREKAFTLIELSIVIVIIGFITAGITAGTNLIKQAELRSIISDLQSYTTSYNNFFGRYNKIPGDMDVASSYFGTDCSATAANCDGNNDGVIDWSSTAGENEVNAAWKHLELAGMINSGFIVVDGAGTSDIGTEVPPSKLAGAGYFMVGTLADNGNIGATSFTGVFDGGTNAIYIAKETSTSSLNNGALRAEAAFNIDRKVDDAVIDGTDFNGATTGAVRAKDGVDATTGDCATDTAYDIANSSTACILGLAMN